MGTSQNKIPPFLQQPQGDVVPPFLKKKEPTESGLTSRSASLDSESSSSGNDILRGAFGRIAKITSQIGSTGFAHVPDERIQELTELSEKLTANVDNARNFIIDDYFTEKEKQNVEAIPTSMAAGAEALANTSGFNPEKVLQEMMADPTNLEKYRKTRERQINERIKELRLEQSQYVTYTGTNNPDKYNWDPKMVITNQPAYNRINSEVGVLSKYLGDMKASAGQLAEIQIISQKIEANERDGKKNIGIPEDIGRNILRVAGEIPGMSINDDQATALEQKKANLGDIPRADLEEIGLNAWRKYLIANPKLKGREGYIMDLQEWEKDFDTRHFEVTAARVRHKIGANLKAKAGFGSAAFRREPTISEIVAAANDADLTESEMKVFNSYVLPVERRNIGTDIPMSGFLNKAGEAVAGSIENLGNVFRSDTERLQEGLNRELDTRYDEVGEWARGKAELEMLEKKEKDGTITPEDITRKIELNRYVNVRNWWDKFWDGSGDLTGQVLYQAALARGFGAVIPDLPVVGLLARGDLPSLMTTSFLTSYDLHAQDAVMLMPRKDQELNRKLYAFTMAGVEGASETIFRDTKILDAFKKNIAPDVVKLTRRITNEGITTEAAKTQFKQLLTNKLKPYAGNFLKAEVQEATEEAVVDVADGIAASVFGGKEFDGSKVFGNAIHTFLTTMAYSPFVSHMAASRDTRQGAYGKSGIYKMAVDPAPYKRAVNALLMNDKISQAEANEKIQIINTASTVMREMPAGKNMDYPARANYLIHRLNEAVLDARIKETFDPIERDRLIEQRDASVAKVRDIYNGTVKFDNDLAEINPNDQLDEPLEESGDVTITPSEDTAVDIMEQVDALAQFDPSDVVQKPRVRVQVRPGGEAVRVEPKSELGTVVMNTYGKTIDQVDPDDSYTVIVPEHLGGLASFIGAEVTPIGDSKNVQVTLSGQQLVDLRDQELKSQNDAISQENQGEVVIPKSGGSQHFSPEESKLKPTQEGTQIPRADRGDSITGSEEQAIPKPRVRVARNEAGDYEVVKPQDEEENFRRQEEQTVGTETTEPGGQGGEGQNQGQSRPVGVEGVYSFSETVEVPISQLSQSQKYRKGRPFMESVRAQQEKPTNQPVLAYRAPDGKTYVLDGRAKIAAAQLRGESKVPVKFLNGTGDQAAEVGDLSRNVPSRRMAQIRADRVQARVPESLEEEVLQGMLTSMRTGRPLFSIRSFKRYITSVITRDPRRRNAGEPTKELLQLIRTNIIGEGGSDLDMYVQEFESRNFTGNDWMDQGYSTRETDFINEIVDTVMSHPTKEKIIERLESLYGLESVPLVDSMLPLRMSEEEAVFVSQAGLNNLLEEIIFNADSIQLTQEESDYLMQMVKDNSNPDGTNLNIESMAFDLQNSDVPEAKSIFKKLTQYADKIERTTPKHIGDSGRETVLGGEENEIDDTDLSAWRPSDINFSRGGGAGKLTPKQARKVGRALSRAFKGLKVSVDRKKFAEALKTAMRESRQSLEVQGLIDQLQKAQDILSAAQRSFTAKQKELNATAQADQENLFGERDSAQGNKLFDERASAAARETAIKPFRDRLTTARNNVNAIQKKLTEASKSGGTQQSTMFSKSVGDSLTEAAQKHGIDSKSLIADFINWIRGGIAKFGKAIKDYVRILAASAAITISSPATAPDLSIADRDASIVRELVYKYYAMNDEVPPQDVINRTLYAWKVLGSPMIQVDTSGKSRAYAMEPNNGRRTLLANIGSLDDLIEELAHSGQFVSGAPLDRHEYLSQEDYDAVEYDRKGSVEYDAHKIIAPLIATYIFQGKTGADLLNSAYFEKSIAKEALPVIQKYLNPKPPIEHQVIIQPTTFMYSKDGERVAGLIAADGNVYLNPDEVNATTPIHEIGGHVLARWAKTNHPALYAKIIRSGRTAPDEIKNYVRQFYKDIDENSEDFAEEVYATAIGWDKRNIERTENIANESTWESFKRTLTDIWNDFVDFLVSAGIIDSKKVRVGFDAKEFDNMSLSDFTNLAGEIMFSGRRVSAPQDQVNIKAMGADFTFLGEDDFVYDYYNNIVGVKPDVAESIAAEKESIRNAAINNGTFMKAPDGSLSQLTEDQWVTTKTRRFQEWDKGELQDVFNAISVPAENPHASLNEMAKDPLRQGEVLAFLENQSQSTSELAGLMDVIGIEAADLYERYKEKKGTVLRGYNGEPMVLYHGTNKAFTAFQKSDTRGNFFSSDPEYASGYASAFGNRSNAMITPVFVKGRLLELDESIVDSTGRESYPGRSVWNQAFGNDVTAGEVELRSMGYDGIVWGTGSGYAEVVSIFDDKNIKSALSNTTFSNESNDVRFQRIGENSKLTPAQNENLNKAKQMEGANIIQEDIFLSTGWFRGLDGEWRYELPNSNVKYTPVWELGKKPLRDVLDYPELFAAHPELATVPVAFGVSTHMKTLGYYHSESNEIGVAADQMASDQLSTLRHEIQHYLQEKLGFEPGSNLNVAKRYLDRKTKFTELEIAHLNAQKRALEVANNDVSSPLWQKFFDRIAEIDKQVYRLKKQLQEFKDEPEYWTNFFYRKYAGERESFGTSERGRMDDAERAITFPADVQYLKETVIMYRDQQLLKPVYSTMSANEFNEEGQLKSDPIVVSKSQLKAKFSVIPGDDNASFIRGLNMWKSTLEIAIKMQENGHDKRVFLTSNEFLSMFGVRAYQQLPADILRIAESIWKLNPKQQAETLKAVNKALNSDGDKKAAFKNEIGKVKKNIIDAQTLREPKTTSVTEDRPETQARVSSILTDIANGLTDDEIIEERRSEIGGIDESAEKRLRRKISEERVAYEEFEQTVREQIQRISQTGDNRYIKQMHLRMMQSKYAGTPAFKRLSDEVMSYERTSKKSMTDRAREIAEAGTDIAMRELQNEASKNSSMVPVLAGAIMERLKVRKDADAQQRVLEIMYQYSHQAGLNLNMVGAFYYMLGMADAAGKINFMVRVKNGMLSKFYDRMKSQGLNSEPFRAVRDIQADVISRARGDSAFAKRIEKLVKNLKGC